MNNAASTTGGIAPVSSLPPLLKFADLNDKGTVVIHIGDQADRDSETRAVWQRTHNAAITENETIDPTTEPEQALLIREQHLSGDRSLFKVADKYDTKQVIIHQHGHAPAELMKALIRELRKQAPHAEILHGRLGFNAEPWQLVGIVAAEDATEQDCALPLAVGSAGFDRKARYLVKGVLPADALAAVYGPSGSFKSFWAIDVACHVASGKAWDGSSVTRGAVLYVVGEGGVGVPRRICAWERAKNDGQQLRNLYRVEMPVFLANESQQEQLILAANKVKQETGEPVRLIVVDTVARCFGGADENRAADMGAFIAGCDKVKAATGATVLLVHHTGKDIERGGRGSSALRGALDTEFFIMRENDDGLAITLTCTKQKDDAERSAKAYDLREAYLYTDEDGDEVATLILLDQGREPAPKIPDELAGGSTSNNHTALWQCVRTRQAKGEAATKTLIRDDMKALGLDVKHFSRWLTKLVTDGAIIVGDDGEALTANTVRP